MSERLKPCVHRDTEVKNKDGKVEGVEPPTDFRGAGFAGIRQEFKHGLCKILTKNDFGPVECRQPKHNEKTCPDIADPRESSSTDAPKSK